MRQYISCTECLKGCTYKEHFNCNYKCCDNLVNSLMRVTALFSERIVYRIVQRRIKYEWTDKLERLNCC